MDLLVLIGAFFVLLVLGCPLGFAMGLSTALYLFLFDGIEFVMMAQRLANGVYKFPLLAIPFFILAGVLMNNLGITDRIFRLARKIVGHITGGLGHVNVLASMLFAGMSGSAIADAGGLGAIEIKAMREAGYSLRFSASITAASSIIGPIIPPSIIIIVYGTLAEVSVADLFAGAIIPGILLGLSLMIMIYIMVKMKWVEAPLEPKASLKELFHAFRGALIPLLSPVILVSGIIFGIFTPTEGGAIAIAYTLLVGVYYRTLNTKVIIESMIESIKSTAVTLFFIATASAFLWIITVEKIPEKLINSVLLITQNDTIILFLLVVVLLIIGMFMSIEATLILIIPVLLSLADALSLDLVHVGIFVILALMVGLISPPVGMGLFIVSQVGNIKLAELSRAILPFLIPIILVVFLVTFFPGLVTFLPSILP